MDDADLALQPEPDVRAALGAIARLRVLVPLIPSIGIGVLRVLRVTDAGVDGPEIVAGYDRYEPLAAARRTA